jgi:hypothetical protein
MHTMLAKESSKIFMRRGYGQQRKLAGIGLHVAVVAQCNLELKSARSVIKYLNFRFIASFPLELTFSRKFEDISTEGC